MKTQLFQFAMVIGLFTSTLCNVAGEDAEIKVAQNVTVTGTGNAQLPSQFNYGRFFVISLNQNIPRFESLKSNLVATLTVKKHLDRVVFDFFSSEKQPGFVEVGVGSRVPLDIAQSIIKALENTPDIKITLTVEKVDGRHGDTQRVYIGGLTQRPQEPVTPDKLRSLLEPQLKLKEFHDIILKRDL